MQNKSKSNNRVSRKGAAQTQLVSKSQVRQMIKSAVHEDLEQKWFDTAAAGNSVNSAASLGSITPIPQGNTAVSRVGIDVQPTEVLSQYTWVGSTDVTNLVRMIIFQWHPDNAIDSPSLGEILETSILGVNLGAYEQYSIPSEQKYKILYDRSFSLVNGSSADTLQVTVPMHRIRGKMLPMKFIGATTGTNMLYVLYVSDSSVVPHPTITVFHRVRFLDG